MAAYQAARMVPVEVVARLRPAPTPPTRGGGGTSHAQPPRHHLGMTAPGRGRRTHGGKGGGRQRKGGSHQPGEGRLQDQSRAGILWPGDDTLRLVGSDGVAQRFLLERVFGAACHVRANSAWIMGVCVWWRSGPSDLAERHVLRLSRIALQASGARSSRSSPARWQRRSTSCC